MNGLEGKVDFPLAAIGENHRKTAVGALNMPRTVPQGGARIAGHDIPGRVRIYIF